MLEPAKRIFVSHSHEDNDFCHRLVRDLRSALHDDDAVWFDAAGLQGGDPWWSKIREELRTREIFIVILSPAAMDSRWVNDEIDLARYYRNSPGGKTIIPLLYRQCDVRDDLKILHIVSFLPPNGYDSAFARLLLALGIPQSTPSRQDSPSPHTPPSISPIREGGVQQKQENSLPDVPSEPSITPPVNQAAPMNPYSPGILLPPSQSITAPPVSGGNASILFKAPTRDISSLPVNNPPKRRISPMQGIITSILLAAVLISSLLVAHLISENGHGGNPGGVNTTGTHTPSNNPFAYKYNAPTHVGGTVAVGHTLSFYSFNPLIAGSDTEIGISNGLFNACLYQLPDFSQGDTGYKPDQCSSLPTESADGLTTTLHIQSGLRWSDGQPLTASDFAFFVKLATDQNVFGFTPFDRIRNVAIVDPTTLQISWKQPFGPYLFAAASIFPLPLHAYPGNFNTSFPAVNGAFEVQSQTSQTVTLVPNYNFSSHYFHKSVLNKIIFQKYTSKSEMISAFHAGQIQVAEDLDENDIPTFTGIPTASQAITPWAGFEFLSFNERTQAPNAAHNHGASIFAGTNGKLVREAFMRAFNRCIALKEAFNEDCGSAIELTDENTQPPAPDYDPNQAAPSNDVSAAKQLMDQAGYKVGANGKRDAADGTPIHIDLYTSANNAYRFALLSSAASQWENALQINCDVHVSNNLFGTGGTLPDGSFDVSLFASVDSDPFDPYIMFYFYFLTTGIPSSTNPLGANFAGISDSHIDQDFASGIAETDSTKRTGIFKNLQIYLSENYYDDPLFVRRNVSLISPALGNYFHSTGLTNEWNMSDWFVTG